MIRIVGAGGGSGLPVLLRGLKEFEQNQAAGQRAETSLTAIVCVSDDGGSSGALRHDFRIPAVGDLRNCLVALAGRPSPLVDLFQYRFHSGNGLNGHSLGNLMVTALHQCSGSLLTAAETAGRLIEVRGRVLPASETPLILCAELEDGTVARGESQIGAAGMRIQRLWLEPEAHQASPQAIQAIAEADTIVLGPGSLYTSILPNVLLADLAEAIRRSPALKIFVCNLMTQPGETDRFTATDHVRVVEQYLGAGVIDICILNSRRIPWNQENRYFQSGACTVQCDPEEIAEMGLVPVSADVVDEKESRVRHDPTKLARLVMSLTRGALRARDIVCGRGMIAV